MEELWKDIDDTNGLYQVSTNGRLRRLNGDKVFIKKLRNYPNGYTQFDMTIKSKRLSGLAHRFVAKAFITNPMNYPVVNHKNGVKDDNRVDNLEWCTHEYNYHHSKNILHNSYTFNRKGEHNARSKLKTSDVLEIRDKFFNKGFTMKELSNDYNVDKPAIWKIIKYRTWSHI